jgi:hypothetical protein
VRRALFGIAVVAAIWTFSFPFTTHASNIQAWVTPGGLTPTPSARVTVHVRGLPPQASVQIGIAGPPPEMGYISIRHALASAQGGVDQPISFSAREPGNYSANISWNGTSGYRAVNIPVRAPLSTNCAGKVALAHVFSNGPEVLVEGTAARPGTTVWLLGIGYDPCSPVSLAIAPPQADYGIVNTHVRTDRFGGFRIPVQVPKGYQYDVLFVYPRVNTTAKPIVAIGVNRYF